MKKYLITFLITSTIFLLAFFISGEVTSSRVQQLHTIQEKISLNILATETRFALLKEASCENLFQGTQLEIGITGDLNNLVTRIKFLENELGSENEDVQLLKQRYTLLQIKDFLLVLELSEKCNYTIPTMLYFHADDCFDCRKQSIVLDQLRDEYDQLRVYWMDTSIHEPAMDTLRRLYDVDGYPAIVLGDKVYADFISYPDLVQEVSTWAQENNLEILSDAQKEKLAQQEEDMLDDVREFLIEKLEQEEFTVVKKTENEFSFTTETGGEGVVLFDEDSGYRIDAFL